MSIPFNDNLSWEKYTTNPNWHKCLSQDSELASVNQTRRAVNDLANQVFKQIFARGFQFVRDLARLVLKVPVRALIITPIFLSKNWKERQRAAINAKLTAYSFVQLLSVAPKFMVAIAAILTSAISNKKAKWLLDKSENWTAHLDGRASQLEALKEVGRVNAPDRKTYDAYKQWVYDIDPKLCRK
jgi:hypothetical protein